MWSRAMREAKVSWMAPNVFHKVPSCIKDSAPQKLVRGFKGQLHQFGSGSRQFISLYFILQADLSSVWSSQRQEE